MLRWLAVLSLAVPSASWAQACDSYVGKTVSLTTFDEVRASLPVVAPRDAYESSADYARRVEQAQGSERAFTIRRIPTYPKEGLSYDPDRKTLTVYGTAFGAGSTNFAHVFGGGYRRNEDNFSSAVGFRISAVEIGQETYEANNGFGARVTVTRVQRQVNALWERAGRPGEDPLLGMRSGRVAVLQMEPEVARDLIEGGSAALMFVPRAPYFASGQSGLAPTFNNPRALEENIDVLIGDVRCAFLLDGQDSVKHAVTVK